jgi:4-amino-4-deoxy-L-arabinose transferase-like glycosyltransferase
MKYKNLFFPLIILFLGFFLRLYKFTTIPFGLNHDASLNGLVAIDLWQKFPQYVPYYTGWVGETLYHYWLIINYIIFGISPNTIKIASIIIGTITLPFFYILARNLQGKTTALFSIFFLAISGWHITMSKVGWLAILVPLLQSITFLLLYKALKHNRKTYWISAGFSLALTLNTYGAARITPILFLSTLLFWQLKHHDFLKKTYVNIIYSLLAFVIAVLPLISFSLNNWGTYNSRANYLSITNKIKEVKSLSPLWNNIRISAGMLHFRANGDDFFVNEPLLEKVPGYLFIIGFIYALFTLKSFESFTIVMWLFLGFLPGILSTPNGNHDFSILVPTYLIIGQGAKSTFGLLKTFLGKKLAHTLMVLILIFSLFSAYQQYLSRNRREIFGLYPEATIIADYMKNNENNYDLYLTDNYPRDILTFTMYRSKDPFKKHYTWFEDGHDFLTIAKGNRGLMFFMFADPQNEKIAAILQKKFTKSKKIYLPYVDDNISRIASLAVIVQPKN